jgi:hypothetical protein
MEGDKREKEEILRTFIETASSFLNLGSFKLEYDNNKIYTNSDLDMFPKKLEVGPLLISYTDKSQNYAGIKTFAGLIIARLKYAFSINSMTVFASNTNQRQIFNKHLKLEPKDGTYNTKDGVEIKVILESEHNRRPSLTQLVYEIENLGENFDKVNEIISAATEEPLTETDPLRAYIKAHAIRNYTYIVYTNKGKKDESQKN